MKFIIYLLSNSMGLWLAQHFLSGFTVTGGLKSYIIAGILLGILNLILRPILKLVFLPLMILTLGLFSIAINALLIWMVAQATGLLKIQDFQTLVFVTLIFVVVNFITHLFAKIV